MRRPSAMLFALVAACSSEGTETPKPRVSSGCIVGSVEDFCAADALACHLSTAHRGAALERFLVCGEFDAGPCCQSDDDVCRSNRVGTVACSCEEASSGERLTLVRFSTGFDGRALYFTDSGELRAVSEWVDTNAYCEHTSPEQWYGSKLRCRCGSAPLGDAGDRARSR